MITQNPIQNTVQPQQAMKSLGRHVRLVSFDVFETALLRQVVEPSDVHYLTASRLGLVENQNIDNYVAKRRLAEEKARKKAALTGRTEIGIAEINAELSELISAELLARRPIQLELLLEQELAAANPDALQLHKRARAGGLAIAFIADTCLPRGLVARMLRSAGYDWDYLFVSSQSGRTKQDGSLFTTVVEQTPFEVHQITHVGDDRGSSAPLTQAFEPDRNDAQSGISSSSQRSQVQTGRRSGVDSVALSMAASHRAKVADKLTPADVGYYAVGPIMAGFVNWVRDQTQASMPDHIILTPRLRLGAELLARVCSPLAEKVRASEAIWATDSAASDKEIEAFLLSNAILPGDHIAVLDLGWDDGNISYVESRLPEQLGATVTGFCVGLLSAPTTNTQSWAFGQGKNEELAERIRNSSFVSLLGSTQSHGALSEVRIQHLVDQIAVGVMAFAEDISPWLAHGPTTATLLWPALRTVESPTYAEAQQLTNGWITGDQAVSFERSTATESNPLRSRLVRSLQVRPEVMGGRHLGTIWAQGSQILESGGSSNKPAAAAHKKRALRTLRFGLRRNS